MLKSIISITKIRILAIQPKFFYKKMQEKAKNTLFEGLEWALFCFIFVFLRQN